MRIRRIYHVWTRLFVAIGCLFALTVSAPFLAWAQQDHDAEQAVDAGAVPDAAPALAPSSSSAVTLSPPLTPVASSSSASVSKTQTGEIKVRDKLVYVIRTSRSGRSIADRARGAQSAIDSALAHPEQLGEVHYEEAQGAVVIYIAKTPVMTLGAEDAEASGEASVSVLAAQVTARLADAVSAEKKRSAIATTVFSVSLLVFSALIAFWLLGRTSELAERLRGWMSENPERLAAIRLGKVELVSAGATRGGSSIALTLGHRFTQIAIAYAWLIFSLSLFETTRGYTEKLTGLMITPLYAFATRIGGALPVFIVAAIAVVAVTVLVRFIGLFFDSVHRGDTRMAWLPRDLAKPTSVLVRFGIVVVALIVASPLITGEADSAFSRVGMIALAAAALSCLPLLASAAVGVVVVYGRRLKRGELVEFGGKSGRVVDIRLLDVRLEDDGACDVSVPHLLGLIHPTRIHRHPPISSVDVVVDSSAPQADVERALLEAARSISSRARVELVYLDGAGAHWRVFSVASRGEKTLGRAVQEAITNLGVALGHHHRAPRKRGDDPAL